MPYRRRRWGQRERAREGGRIFLRPVQSQSSCFILPVVRMWYSPTFCVDSHHIITFWQSGGCSEAKMYSIAKDRKSQLIKNSRQFIKLLGPCVTCWFARFAHSFSYNAPSLPRTRLLPLGSTRGILKPWCAHVLYYHGTNNHDLNEQDAGMIGYNHLKWRGFSIKIGTEQINPHTIWGLKRHRDIYSAHEPDTWVKSTTWGYIVGHFWHRNACLSVRVVRVKDVKVCKNPCSHYSDFTSLSRKDSTVSTLGTSWWLYDCAWRETTLEKH